MIFQILALFFAVALPIVAVLALLRSPSESARDRSARSVEPLAAGCLVLLFVGVALLIYFSRHL